MDWVTNIRSIHEILKTKGFSDVSDELAYEQLKGGTGGEIFILAVSKLISIKEQRPEVYALIKEEAEWIILYARKIHYLP